MAARRYRPGKSARQLFEFDTSQLDAFGEIMSTRAPRDLRIAFARRIRIAAKKIKAAVQAEAPVGPTGYLKRSGVRLSSSRSGIFIRIVGQRGYTPSNIGYLVNRGHRKRGGGKTRANRFLDRGLKRSRRSFEREMGAALDDSTKAMEREVKKISRARVRVLR